MVFVILIIILLLFWYYSGGEYIINNNKCDAVDNDEEYESRGLLFETEEDCKKILNIINQFNSENYANYENLFKLLIYLPVPLDFLEKYVYTHKTNKFSLEFIEYYKSPVAHIETYKDISLPGKPAILIKLLLEENGLFNSALSEKIIIIRFDGTTAFLHNYNTMPSGDILSGLIDSYKDKDYIIFSMELILNNNLNHANTLIVDKKNQTFIRVEPNMTDVNTNYAKSVNNLLKTLAESIKFKYTVLSDIITSEYASGQQDLGISICGVYTVLLTILCIKNKFNKEIILPLTSGVNNTFMTMILLFYTHKKIEPNYADRIKTLTDPNWGCVPGYDDLILILSDYTHISEYNKYIALLHEINKIKNKSIESLIPPGVIDNTPTEKFYPNVVYDDETGLIDIDGTCEFVAGNSSELFYKYVMGNGKALALGKYTQDFYNSFKNFPSNKAIETFYGSLFNQLKNNQKIIDQINDARDDFIPYLRDIVDSFHDISNDHKYYGLHKDCYEQIKEYIDAVNEIADDKKFKEEYEEYFNQTAKKIKSQTPEFIELMKKYGNIPDDMLSRRFYMMLLMLKAGNKTENISYLIAPGAKYDNEFEAYNNIDHEKLFRECFINSEFPKQSKIAAIALQLSCKCARRYGYATEIYESCVLI